MRELLTVTLIEKCSELEKKHVYSDMIERTVTMLDVGVTRLVSRLCQVTTAQLEFSPPTLNDDNTGPCPGCVAKYQVPMCRGMRLVFFCVTICYVICKVCILRK